MCGSGQIKKKVLYTLFVPPLSHNSVIPKFLIKRLQFSTWASATAFLPQC